MFKLTEKAKQFNERFIIQHTECGDYDLSADYFCVNEAIVYEAADVGCSEEEMAKTIREYTPEEVIKAAEEGYGWPINLGLVEEYDDEEENDDIAFDEENLESIDEELLKKCIKCVEADSDWGDWLDGQDIIQMYAPDEWCDEVCWVLDRAVESNGESLKEDLPLIERQLFGRNMSGSFYDR